MAVHAKLLKVKGELPFLKKDKSGYGYKYVSGMNILSTVNPLLEKHNLFVFPRVVDSSYERVVTGEKINNKTGETVIKHETLYTISMVYTIVDTEDNESVEIPWFSSGCNNEEQGVGSAYTYGQRYFWLNLFGIPTDENDPDLKNRTSNSNKTATPKQPATPKAGAKEVLTALLMKGGYKESDIEGLTEGKYKTIDDVISTTDAEKRKFKTLISKPKKK